MTSRMPRWLSDEPANSKLISWPIVALYFVLALLYFAPAFFPDRQIAGTDYLTGGYYFLEFAMQRIGNGHLPNWVPYVFGGLPMYSNPGGLYYPVRLLFSALLPVARVMAAVYVVQFAVAGIGMHLFARALGARMWVAFVAGLMFELTGVTMSYVYAGQDGRIIAATLTPLAFYFLLRGIRTGETRWFAGLATTIAFVLLSFQLQSAYYLLIGGGLWALFLLVRMRHELTRGQLLRRVVLGLAAVTFAFSLAAVNLVPFSGYVKDSPRSVAAKRDFAFSTQFSMPIVETLGFAVPEQAGILNKYQGQNLFKLHTEYVGALAILLLIVGAAVSLRDRVWQFMALLAAFMMSISYGSHTPLYGLYYQFLPGTRSFRSPSIALFIVSFCLVTMAALALEELARRVDAAGRDKERVPRGDRLPTRLLSAVVALAVVGVVVALGTALDGGPRALGWARFGVFFVVTSIVLRIWMRGRLSARVAVAALAVLTATDLLVIDRNFFWTQPPPEQMFAEDDVVKFLKRQPPGRVWVFPFPEEEGAARYLGNGRFGLHSNYLMHFGIPQAGGEHGNQLYRWNQLAGIAPSGNVLDWHNFVEYPSVLDAAGVRYIVSGVRLELFDVETKTGVSGIREAFRGSAFVYVNDKAFPRVMLVPNVRAVGSTSVALAGMQMNDWNGREFAYVETATAPFVSPPTPATAITEGPGAEKDRAARVGQAFLKVDDPDRIIVGVHAVRPALLVVTDNYADGWVATIDGKETPIIRTNHTFRGVPVTAGDHEVIFEFKPPRVLAGLWISGISWLLLLAGLLLLWRHARSARVGQLTAATT